MRVRAELAVFLRCVWLCSLCAGCPRSVVWLSAADSGPRDASVQHAPEPVLEPADAAVPVDARVEPAADAGATADHAGEGGAGMQAAGQGGAPMAGAAGGGGSMPSPAPGCGLTLPAVSDFGAAGPFSTTTRKGTGPNGTFTVIRPAMLGKLGGKHPIAVWGSAFATNVSAYAGLLNAIASHGFVIIASDSTNATDADLSRGLEWLATQNGVEGEYRDMLVPRCAVALGHSRGAAALIVGGHDYVVTTIAFHPWMSDTSHVLGPLLLFTSMTDTIAPAMQYSEPAYTSSAGMSFYATLAGLSDQGHATPRDDGGAERAPAIAWLRFWVYGDRAAEAYFNGDACVLCTEPWVSPRRQNWP